MRTWAHSVALNIILPKRHNLILKKKGDRTTTIKLCLVKLGNTITLVYDPEIDDDEIPLQVLRHENEDLDVVLEHEAVYVRVPVI